MANPFVHIEIRTRDMAKCKAFYGKVFDWKVAEQPNYGPIDTGTPPAGGIYPAPPEVPLGVAVYVGVDSIEETVQKVRDAGGQIVVEKQEVPGMGWFSTFLDPEGNEMSLWQPMEGTP
jgi:predicted enzyme related to lactoylglutathione lyase